MLALLLALLSCSVQALAGRTCEAKPIDARDREAAARAGARLKTALDASGAEVAMVARVGQDLRKHGLVYSHAGFALKTAGRWKVIHLLNDCGSDRGALFEEGLTEFFTDSPFRYQAKWVSFNPSVAAALRAALIAHQGKAVFEPRYSVIARVGSPRRQNSTAWALEVLSAANHPLPDSRKEASLVLESLRYQPDIIHIGYGKRIAGGLFRANAVFTDHPLSTRLSGNYPVSTVRSIFRFARQQNWLTLEQTVEDGLPPLPGD